MKDHELRELVNTLTATAIEFAGTQQLRERIAGIVRPAIVGENETAAGVPTQTEIADRLRRLADEMDDISVTMDYYGGLSEWAKHGREIAGAGAIARQWAGEIEAENNEKT